ncbi:MAG: extracellular solute-binding protein [Desulfurococcaceae archaeon]
MRHYLILIMIVAIIVASIAGILIYQYMSRTPSREVKLTVVTRLAPEEGAALRERFLNSSVAREYGIVDIEFIKEDIAKWPIYAEEGRADLFFIGGYAVYKDLCEKGYLRPIEDPDLLKTIEAIGAMAYRDVNGRVCFIATAMTVFSYTVNTEFLEKYQLPVPRKWSDLMRPEFSEPLLAGEALVSFPKPSKSTTSARTIQLILQKYGWVDGWVLLTIMGANSFIVESSEKARDDVALGVAGIAPTVLVYGIRAEELSGGKAKFIVTEGEVLPDISPVAIAKNTGNLREAYAFIKWLLSVDGQRALAELFYYMPFIKPEGTKLEEIYEGVKGNIFNYDPEDAAQWERSAVYYFEATIADPDANTLLKNTWRKAMELYKRGLLSQEDLTEIAHKLGEPLVAVIGGEVVHFTKEYAVSINKRLAEDPVFRSEFIDAFRKAAIDRYSALLRSLEFR